ncbi:hypothetical protein [Streptomyces sp. Ru73]|uniref:pPIWI_RE_Z domain-containing protein n=1 Tax=Streptomyces sp. Ru73 TaxID=2080748 RepID=UPI0015E33C15|nr:hypothetical protein [Streptomyces sp. Ru73]
MASLIKELEDDSVSPYLGPLLPRELCQLELGLTFLADHMPGQGVGALWPVLSTYVSPRPGLEREVRALRLLMGDMARSGQFLRTLDAYAQLPAQIRGFERAEPPGRQVRPSTVFTPKSSPYLVGRHDTYRQALKEPVPYRTETRRRPVPPGAACTFRRTDGSTESVHIPKWINPGEAPVPAPPSTARTREVFSFTRHELVSTGEEMDRRLVHHPHVLNGDFAGRLRDLDMAVPNPATGQLRDDCTRFEVDGTMHSVGLMNSGKSTLLDGLTVLAVNRGMRGGYVLPSVGDSFAKTSLLRALGIDAVPKIGQGERTRHVAAYWRSLLQDGESTFPDHPDAAARFAVDVCLLDPLIGGDPLEEGERPCRNALQVVGQRGRCDCPLLPVCPRQRADNELDTAQVQITTPAGLVFSRAAWSDAAMRVVERFQHDLDFLFVDEADDVQRAFDEAFLQHEVLTDPDSGWSTRTRHGIADGLDRNWHMPLQNPRVQKFEELERRHGQARVRLYQLLVAPEGESLRTLLAEGPFTGHSVLFRLARDMHGLGERQDFHHNADREDAAKEFFEQFLEPLSSQPFSEPSEGSAPLLHAMTAAHDTGTDPDNLALQWIRAHMPGIGNDDESPRLAQEAIDAQGENTDYESETTEAEAARVRLLQAGIWAARITASFFEMGKLYPAVAEVLRLPEDLSFLGEQPPKDLLAFVPEQPAGNLMALQWQPNPAGDSGALHLVWLRGVGRWLLHHLHDLLTPEGIDGPHVILTSATSWLPTSPKYHIDLPVSLVLRTPAKARAALLASRMHLRPGRTTEAAPVFVSGTGGDRARREQALMQVTASVCVPRPGAPVSLLDQVRQHLASDRQQVLFVVLSTRDAQTVADYVNHKTPYKAMHVVRDHDEPGPYGLIRRRASTFPRSGADILVAAEGAIQRGHNILNARRVAALGAIFYLVRIHPPADDASFVLSLLGADAMRRLNKPNDLTDPAMDAVDLALRLRHGARRTWRHFGQPILFSRLTDQVHRDAFTSNLLNSTYQTSGRGIRGNEPVLIYLCDAAFAPRAAQLDETAADTERTSVLVAARTMLRELLTEPSATAGPEERLRYELGQACWGLAGHLYDTLDWGR